MEILEEKELKGVATKLNMVSVPEAPVWRISTPTDHKRNPRVKKAVQQLGLMVLIGLLSVACYFGISHFLLESVQVVGVSMVPTLQDSNHYLLNRWAFNHRQPRRGDVVVIRDPADHGYSVKRIVAVAGESVHFVNGKVFINGKELNEPYLSANMLTFTYSQAKEQFITCGKEQYFVMGDNRLASIDSRAYGPVLRQDILGLIVLR
jgi:signal peptidase I